MEKYQALLFAPDGDWVVDCKGETIEDVIGQIGNLGSKWYFYPLAHFIVKYNTVTTERQRIIAAHEPFEFLQGKTIKTVKQFIQDNPEFIESLIDYS